MKTQTFEMRPGLLFMITGGLYAVFGGFTLLSSIIQASIQARLSSQIQTLPPAFSDTLQAIHQRHFTFMPLLALLGIAYLGVGLLKNLSQKHLLRITLFLGILGWVWCISYMVSADSVVDSMISISEQTVFPASSNSLLKTARVFGSVWILCVMTVPQLIIWRFVKKDQRRGGDARRSATSIGFPHILQSNLSSLPLKMRLPWQTPAKMSFSSEAMVSRSLGFGIAAARPSNSAIG